VYRSFCPTSKETVSEILKFFICRGGSGIFDYFSVILLVEFFGWSDLYSKYFVLGIVILANYYLGKNFIFNQKGKKR
jgi:putative flippase GtrA